MLGNAIVVLALLSSLFSLWMYFRSYKGDKEALNKARIGFHLTTVLIIFASALLLYFIVTHQYHIKYVFDYSDSNLTFGLLLSTFFAGQEGSFLLWVLFSVILGVILLIQYQKKNESEAALMLGYLPTIIFLLVLITPFMKSPFNYLWSDTNYIETRFINQTVLGMSAVKNFLFNDGESQTTFLKFGDDLIQILKANGVSSDQILIQGKGLNPLLQNFWMQIHPPILFLGFALAGVPFAFAFSSLVRNEYKSWVDKSLPWVIAVALVLGLGIMLGGYWAYGVLGWGGYWAWDPVENASLVPWIICIALLHTLLLQKQSQIENKNGKFIKTNLFLAGFTFILVIYSTFLTRSGILADASVHSFTDPGSLVYNVLLISLLTFLFLLISAMFIRRKSLSVNSAYSYSLLSRESGLFYGAVVLIGSALSVLLGTSAPIFGQSVEIEFYNQMNLPLAVIMLLLIAFTLYLNWKNTDQKIFVKKLSVSLALSILLTVIVSLSAAVSNVLYILLIFSSLFTMVTNVELIIRSNKNVMLLGGHVAHIGFGIFLIGVLLSAILNSSAQFELIKNQTYEFNGKEIKFTGFTAFDSGSKYQFNVEVKDGGSSKIANPVMFVSSYNNSIMREPHIMVGALYDLYISPVSYNEGTHQNTETSYSFRKGYPVKVADKEIMFVKFDMPEDAMAKMMNNEKFDLTGVFEIKSGSDIITKNIVINDPENNIIEFDDSGKKYVINSFDVSGVIQITSINETEDHTGHNHNETLAIEISEKPFINLVWAGVIVMAIGLTIVYARRKE
ncbi:MAG: cytochrome c biogenesis protein CcsA [Bacteroidetes bacterium]|nr:cytochrome c biogenesis protein CcsA [Bacteroidota bacterium]